MSDALPPDELLPDAPSTSALHLRLEADAYWMHRALELARQGAGRVEPNPMVGCVLVRDGREISHGWHQRFGGPHAEVNTLSSFTTEDVRHCDLFVTLEPCAHQGKTPPCLDLLLKLRPKRVIVAMQDPFPEVAGRGIAGLRNAGIQVDVGILEGEAKNLNAPYLKRIQRGLPWVIAKWAMTLDGAIATETGDSQWITGEVARQRAHVIRSRMDAIVVGSETVLQDDPLLTARLAPPLEIPRQASRVVVDRRLRIPIASNLVRTARTIPLCIVTTQQAIDAQPQKANQLEQLGTELLILPTEANCSELGWLLQHLHQSGATNVLVEGGGKLLGSFFDGGWVDQVDCFIAPRVLGSEQAARPVAGMVRRWINDSQKLENVSIETCGIDIHVRGFLNPGVVPMSHHGPVA